VRVEVDAHREQAGSDEANEQAVETRQLLEAGAGVIVTDDERSPRAPLAANLESYARVDSEVADVTRFVTVLADQPEDVAVESTAERCAPREAAVASDRFE
jgi:hypothetical protein